MKKAVLFLSIITLAIIAFSSCKKVSGEGPVVTETRSIADFSEIKSQFSGNTYITYGPTYSVTIEAQQNIIDALETTLSNGRLTVKVKEKTVLDPDETVKVHITTPNILGLFVSGSGNMYVINKMLSSDLILKVNGSGNINIAELEANNINGEITGSGEINIAAGKVNRQTLDISGSGSMDLLNLESKNADIKISGSGNASLFVTDNLKVRISGSGNVSYKGNPAVDVNITGSGKLNHL